MKNMKTLRVKMVGLLATALILFSAFRADKPVITIFMIGDSTMANKKIDGGNPERGWGMVLPGFFSEDIRIDNHAANGRSSKSFISEGRWEKVISNREVKYVYPADVVDTLARKKWRQQTRNELHRLELAMARIKDQNSKEFKAAAKAYEDFKKKVLKPEQVA